MVGGCGFVVAAGLQVFCSCEGHGQRESAPSSVACVVHAIALVTRVSSIGQVCLAINAVR